MKLNYIKHKIANLISINKIVTIHYYEFDKSFSFEGESHDFWEMVYIDSGEVEIDADKRRIHLKQGDVVFHKPNEFHTIKAYNEATNVFVISFVCTSETMNFFCDKTVHVPVALRRIIGTIIEEYLQTFKPMSSKDVKLEIKENPPVGGQQMIRIYLEQLLIMLIRNEQENRKMRIFPSRESMENHLVSNMIHIIEENIYSEISITDICTNLNYSRAYLSKIFKLTTGYTLLEYISTLKIKEAKKLIREGRYNFTQISDLLCFDNPHYFSSVFKRITNMTPTEYKTSVKKP